MRALVIIAGEVLMFLRRFRAKRAVKAISRVELLKCLEGDKTLQDFLLDFRSREKPLFFWDKKNPEFLQVVPVQSKEIIKDADRTCERGFELLGACIC